MESQSPFFSGSVVDAVTHATSRNCTFLVFLHDDSSQSADFERTLNSPNILILIRTETVGLRLSHDSPDAAMFAQLFPVNHVPSMYLIRASVLRDVITSPVSNDDVLARLSRVIEIASEGPIASQAAVSSSQVPPSQTSPPQIPGRVEGSEGESSRAEEERIAKQEKLRRQIEENRKKREAEEKEKLRQQEISRRNEGKNLQNFQRDHKDKEAKRIADELAKERREANEARSRVREQIAHDKAERAAKRQKELEERRHADEDFGDHQTSTSQPASRAAGTHAKISIRQLDGATLRNQFNAEDALSDVQKWITENRTDGDAPYVFLQTFPHRTFTAGDESRTLAELELTPSGTLIMRAVKNVVSATESESGIVWNVLSTGGSAVTGIFGGLTSLASSAYGYMTSPSISTDSGAVGGDNGGNARTSDDGRIGTSSSRNEDDPKRSNRRPYGANVTTLSSPSNEESDRDSRPTYNGNSTNQM